MSEKDISRVDMLRSLRFLCRFDGSAADQVVMVAPVVQKVSYASREREALWPSPMKTVDLSARDIARACLQMLDEQEARQIEAVCELARYGAKRTARGFGKLPYGVLDSVMLMRDSLGVRGAETNKAISDLRYAMMRKGLLEWETAP